LTRLPVPHLPEFEPDWLSRSARYVWSDAMSMEKRYFTSLLSMRS
jgi:hypothetical protein